ncbi:hypothetical protein BaRGS_00010523 [Batillaria attramentaria]|uniref:Uncharacterized protein n=1 Tax=Batillaria attramentaria TaxID=370345 RepID=A0ABD0LFT2_9CAEN
MAGHSSAIRKQKPTQISPLYRSIPNWPRQTSRASCTAAPPSATAGGRITRVLTKPPQIISIADINHLIQFFSPLLNNSPLFVFWFGKQRRPLRGDMRANFAG